MRVSLRCVTCEDRFGSSLARSGIQEVVRLVALPPGFALAEAVNTLCQTVGESGHANPDPLPVVEDADSPISQLRDAVARMVGCEQVSDSIEELVVGNPDRFSWPRLAVVPVASGIAAEELANMLRWARQLAEATKNLEGPIHSVFIVAAGTHFPDGEMPEVWSPWRPVVEDLPYGRAVSDIIQAGFDVYLSLRVYWEAAGCPDDLTRLEPVFRRSPELVLAADADRRVDRIFDDLAEDKDDHGELLEIFGQAFEEPDVRVVLKTGAVSRPKIPAWRLVVAGLAWCPPGQARLLVTPNAARCLSRSPKFRQRHGMTDETCSAFRRAVRNSPVLASWIWQLATHVEREMVIHCQRDPAINRKIEQLGLREKLIEERARVDCGLAYDLPSDLVEYGSFGDLQTVITGADFKDPFPASAKRLEQIRLTRNLCAHLHPVTWPAVRSVLMVLGELRH